MNKDKVTKKDIENTAILQRTITVSPRELEFLKRQLGIKENNYEELQRKVKLTKQTQKKWER